MSTDESSDTVLLPGGEGTEGARRTRRLRIGIVSAIASRGIAAVAPLMLIPLTFGYLETHVYGLWMAVVSLTSMALWADLGLGNGLMTRLSHAIAVEDRRLGRQLVSTAYFLLSVFALTCLLFLLVIVQWIPWDAALNIVDSDASPLAPRIALICLGAFILNIPFSLIQRIQYSHQEVAQSNAWVAAGSVASVALAWTAVRADLGVTLVILGVALGPILGNLLNTAWFFHRHRDSVPRPRDVGGVAARSMVGLGGRFLAITLVSSVALNVDTLLIAHTSGLDEAAVYSVAARVMTALGLLVTLINLPLWPANVEALAKGDSTWVVRTTRRMSLLSAASVAVPGLMLAWLCAPLFSWWLGPSTPLPSQELVISLSLWWVLPAAISPVMMVLNAVGATKAQLIGWSAFLLASIPLKLAMGTAWGPVGVVAAGILTYFATVWPAALLGYRAQLRVLATNSKSELIPPRQIPEPL
jgi:O-antigen/teichoic acid export membrane protein